ncbi:MAG: histidinol-phosphatase [Desulfobacterales bacterium]|nr:histidinol-phosphatase [Desulfobacterales bacterium]
MKTAELVSIHGGHSGEFCCHATDTLEEVIKEYIRKGFEWVGITEHMPPLSDKWLFDDEVAANMNAKKVATRFSNYIKTCRALQKKYADDITIYVAFETEAYSGSEEYIKKLIAEYQPDYFVGSVHHVEAICFDETPENYQRIVEITGSLDNLYTLFFDIQYEMIKGLEPPVIGHFDNIRVYDPDYPERILKPDIWSRINRNLELIKSTGSIMDMNLRSFLKGAKEPYISRPILLRAKELGIAVVPGDDSHGVSTAGLNVDKGVKILQDLGFDTNWKKPC